MSHAVWVVHLDKNAICEVEQGQSVSQDQLLARTDDKEYLSPTDAKVKEISDQKIKLKFQTKKIAGQGYGKSSVWGVLKSFKALKLPEINYQLKNHLIFVPLLTNLLVKKGAVVGVKGFITCQWPKKSDKLKTPVLVVDTDQKTQLAKYENKNCLLHSSKDCILIPENEN